MSFEEPNKTESSSAEKGQEVSLTLGTGQLAVMQITEPVPGQLSIEFKSAGCDGLEGHLAWTVARQKGKNVLIGDKIITPGMSYQELRKMFPKMKSN